MKKIDRPRININEPCEVQYPTKGINVSIELFKLVVRVAENDVKEKKKKKEEKIE